MATIVEQITDIKNHVNGLASLVQGTRDKGLLHTLLGNAVIYGCKIVPAALGFAIKVDGAALGDEEHLNPDVDSPPVRLEQYANIAIVYGEVFLSEEQESTLSDAPGTGYGRYDIVYGYVWENGAAIQVQSGTASVATKIDFDSSGLDSTGQFDPALPHGVIPLARIYVDENVTAITNDRIVDLRDFNGRLRGEKGDIGEVNPLTIVAELNAANSEISAALSEATASAEAINASVSEVKASNWAEEVEDTEVEPGLYSAKHHSLKAAASASVVQSIYDSFDDRYLGAKASAPTLDNDGDSLATGAFYFDTTVGSMLVWDGSTWRDDSSLAEASAIAANASQIASALSETNSASSAAASLTSETNSGNSAAAALVSENNAATSESAAAISEANSAGSQNAAATSETNSGISAAATLVSENNSSDNRNYSEEWANKTEDLTVSIAAGGDGSTEYSARHWATKANADRLLTDIDKTQTGLDAISTAVDVVTTTNNAATSTTNKNLTSADVITTNADVVTTNADVLNTNNNVILTNADALTTDADSTQTGLDKAATNADVIATNADVITTAGNAVNALASENAAAGSLVLTNAAKDATLAALDSFDDRYLGEYITDPTLDNDSNALVSGSLYFNPSEGTQGVMKVYNGTAWLAAYADLAGALIATSNLSELTNIVTAKTNLLLQNIDNTSDLNKPISTLVQTALDAKIGDLTAPGTIGGTTPGIVNATDVIATGDIDMLSGKYIGHDAWNRTLYGNGNTVLMGSTEVSFIIDSNNNATGEKFTWAKDSNDISLATDIMTLNEAGDLSLTGTMFLSSNIVLTTSQYIGLDGNNRLFFNSSSDPTLMSAGNTNFVIDANNTLTTSKFAWGHNGNTVAGAEELMTLDEAGLLTLTLGGVTTNGPVTVGASHHILNTSNTTTLTISGGTASNAGANILLYGGAEASNADDIRFRASGTTALQYDDSASTWDFQDNTVRIGGEIDLTGASRLINADVTNSWVAFSGGNTLGVGANLTLYGSTHASVANDIRLRADSTDILYYDFSLNTWDFQASKILMNRGITSTGGVSIFSRLAATQGTLASSAYDDGVFGSTDTFFTGISLMSNGGSGIMFGDVADNDVGRILYTHSSDTMEFFTNGVKQLIVDSAGNLVHSKGQTRHTANSFTTNIDLSLGHVFHQTMTVARTLTFSNVAPSGTDCYALIHLYDAGDWPITWWSGIKWVGSSAPGFTSNKDDLVLVWTRDGGTTWYGQSGLDFG